MAGALHESYNSAQGKELLQSLVKLFGLMKGFYVMYLF